jgi:hypothetical protein
MTPEPICVTCGAGPRRRGWKKIKRVREASRIDAAGGDAHHRRHDGVDKIGVFRIERRQHLHIFQVEPAPLRESIAGFRSKAEAAVTQPLQAVEDKARQQEYEKGAAHEVRELR